MKRILGLDLGTTSIGWALVEEAENENEKSKIIKLGVRVNPLTVDEKTNFEKGKPITTNADRTLKRGARRNLQRFKQRRKNLIEILNKHQLISPKTPLTEIGKNTTYKTLKLRADSARGKVSLEDLAKVFLIINKKRGYKSSRKAQNEEEGQAIDGMAVAKTLYENGFTPGSYVFNLLSEGKKFIPDFYRSDLKAEFDKIWNVQKVYYPQILRDDLYEKLQDKNKTQTWAICQSPFEIEGIKQKGTKLEQRKERYEWRTKGLQNKLELEHLAIVLQDINNNLNQSSGYLGAISDRSKELYFNKETVGENLYNQILKNPHTSLKNQVFYRQDYLDEFEQIWETQAKFYSVLTPRLKEEIRDVIIFYQRKLKSQKGLLSYCEFESWQQSYLEKETGKSKVRIVGRKVIPKSSPLFQEFKIWQNLNIVEFVNRNKGERIKLSELDTEVRNAVFAELNMRGNLKANEVLKLVGNFIDIGKTSEWKCNFKEVEGNRTNKALYNIYQKVTENEGYGFDWAKKSANEINKELKVVFPQIGIDTKILNFDACEKDIEKQESYQFWHLLYSAEDDLKITDDDKLTYGNSAVSLKKKLHKKYGFKPEYATLLANLSMQQDYGNLSTKAIRKILPYLMEGNDYSKACSLAGYNHSNSLTADEQRTRELKPNLEIVKKNSLRNPVVEKILNQMVDVVNQIVESYGKPDEVRIELARELKKSAKQREKMTKDIADATKRNDDIKNVIRKEFGIPNPTKNDVVRFRLWQELEARGYKSIYTNKYISREILFSKQIDIDHIIPQALLFDDSFSNKTLAFRSVNLNKSNRTAIDYISDDLNNDKDNYILRVEKQFKDGHISKAKRNKLLMEQNKLPEGFIERDLRNSQYIAKKAKQMLFEVFRGVVSTSGSITDKLREGWDLINVMKELNMPKYNSLGLTEFETRRNNKRVKVIKEWTKRNDHRHHAMDALTVAFTTHRHIQYLNNLNARRNEEHEKHKNILSIEAKITEKDNNGKRKFIAPTAHFREDAKKHIEAILISFKNKNKVVTWNINKSKLAGKDKYNKKLQRTPRGQLHKETIYGTSKRVLQKPIKINKRFTIENANLIINKEQQNIVLNHLAKYENNSEIAFDNKTLKTEPLEFNGELLKEVKCFENIYTIRKPIAPDLKIDKVVDEKIRQLLKKRLKEYDGKPKIAFSDLEKNPIWLNEEKGIAVKRVTITGVSNAEPLHYAKDHLGIEINDKYDKPIPTDYVSTGNNHHIAIYRDENGKLNEKVVSFFEAVARVDQNLPIIDKGFNKDIGWQFLFTMKQNEMFIFPTDDFNPSEVDLLDSKNAELLSKHLFRVQKISTKDYVFNHHLETKSVGADDFKNKKMLSDISYKRYQSEDYLKGIVKVRINHIGKIVQVGEY